jgi:hypothetical protein
MVQNKLISLVQRTESWSEGNEDFLIGIKGLMRYRNESVEHEFSIYVISPDYLKWMLTDGAEEYIFGARYLIVNTFNKQEIENIIRNVVKRSKGETWIEYKENTREYLNWV